MTPLKQRGKIRRAYIYTKGEDLTDIYKYKGGRFDGHIYILRGRSDGHIYTIRLNNMPPLKQRVKIRRTHIYYTIEQQASTKTKGEEQTDTYIY